ncbi:MAG: hypothetical protein DDT40_00122 [candidate division WS2 bacterium]|uniref:Metallopeptidase family protein n=1 Tax=Psychracetigena formicireducens TaxID=2986056 RepID=A0A9E2F1Q0_PSYF1|nr:hypothetical protein [Candidatus Psychracetigena formicireducens]MBT9144927.1 hypothetical protein [Candidatus Psychracetigena formicireducens]MBT9149956.1 hypothetical protein [Candidatus Psychracetigena formicireducens]
MDSKSMIDEEQFMEIAISIFDGLKSFFSDKLQNIALVVEDQPSEEQLQSLNIKNNQQLLGLYQGCPYSKRGVGYNLVAPDRIVLFKNNIEERAKSPEEIPDIIEKVLIHEIGHYLGLGEQQLRFLEKKNKVRF